MLRSDGRRGFAGVLRQRDLRILLGAFFVDETCSWGYTVVLAAYAYERTGGTGWIAVIACTRWITGLIVSGAAGVIADRYERSRLVAISGVACAGVMAAMTVAVASDAPLWILPVLSVLDVVVSAPVRPATGALIPELVPESRLIAANSLFAALENLVIVVGPAIGGLFLLAGAPAVAVGINAVSYLVAALLFLRVRIRSRGDAQPGEARVAQWTAGVQALIGTPATFLLALFLGLAAAVYGAAVVVYAPLSVHLGTGAAGYSYLLAASAVGGLIAAGWAERLSAAIRLAPVIVGGIALAAIPFWLSAYLTNGVAGAFMQLLSGMGMVAVDVLAVTVLQRDLPRAVIGRALAAVGAVCLAATVIGNLGASLVLSTAGLTWTLTAIGLAFPLIALTGLPALTRCDQNAAASTEALRPTVALLEELDLFAGAPRSALELLAAAGQRRTAHIGDVLIRQGDEPDAIWLLASGRLGVVADGVPMPDVTAPGYVGEIGVLHGTARSATVTVLDPADVVRIDAADFRATADMSSASPSLLSMAGERLERTPIPAAVAAARPVEKG